MSEYMRGWTAAAHGGIADRPDFHSNDDVARGWRDGKEAHEAAWRAEMKRREAKPRDSRKVR